MNDSLDTKQAGSFHSTQEWRAGQSGQRLKPALYLVATPIGNLRDITLRALDVLEAADRIYCEDTRVTRKLLSAYGIGGQPERCDEHMEKRKVAEILAAIRAGQVVAYVSDAGTPCISDPGAILVQACHRENVPVCPVPGPSAAIATLSVAGLSGDMPFTFMGFLPLKSGARRKLFREWGGVQSALLFYEAPQRMRDTLEDISAILGERPVLIARELTKLHENFYAGTPETLRDVVTDGNFRGEVAFVLYPEPQDEAGIRDDGAIDDALRAAMESLSLKEAVAQVTAQSGLPRKQVYARALALGREA